MKRCSFIVTALAALSLVAAGCGGDDDGGGSGDGGGDQASTFKIGYAASKTGRLAFYEQEFLKGLQAQVDAINADGGAGGVQLELDARDCATDPQKCGVVAQELIDEGAGFLVGPCDVDASLPAAQLAQRDGVGIINSCGSGASFREQIGDSAFLNTYGTIATGQGMAEFAWDQGWKTAAVTISSDIEYTESIPQSATERFEELGGEVVASEQFKLDQPRYTGQANAIAAADPDVVFTPMFLPASNTFLRELRAAGYTGPVLGGDGLEAPETFAAGAAAKDVYVLTHGFREQSPEDTTERFYAMYEEQTGSQPKLIHAALGGDVAVLVAAAVEEAGSTDPEAVRSAFDGLEDVLAPTGSITYAGHAGIPAKDVVILKTDVPKKRFVFVDRFVPEVVQEGGGS